MYMDLNLFLSDILIRCSNLNQPVMWAGQKLQFMVDQHSDKSLVNFSTTSLVNNHLIRSKLKSFNVIIFVEDNIYIGTIFQMRFPCLCG